jgi:hypothetical protein
VKANAGGSVEFPLLLIHFFGCGSGKGSGELEPHVAAVCRRSLASVASFCL